MFGVGTVVTMQVRLDNDVQGFTGRNVGSFKITTYLLIFLLYLVCGVYIAGLTMGCEWAKKLTHRTLTLISEVSHWSFR